jgi:hypothetical protein
MRRPAPISLLLLTSTVLLAEPAGAQRRVEMVRPDGRGIEAGVDARGGAGTVRKAILIFPAPARQATAGHRNGTGLRDGDDTFPVAGTPAIAPRDVDPPGGLAPPSLPWGDRDRRDSAGGYATNCGVNAYRPAGFLRADVEFRRSRVYPLVSRIACEFGIPVGLFDAMIIQESRYRADAVSVRNAYGFTQLMVGTAAALHVDRYDQEANLRGGARYLRSQVDRFGRYHLALAAYNAGPGRVRDGRIPRIAETQAYVSQILSYWSRLGGGRAGLAPALEDATAQLSARPRIAMVAVFE